VGTVDSVVPIIAAHKCPGYVIFNILCKRVLIVLVTFCQGCMYGVVHVMTVKKSMQQT
jgi:hypothetical protein